MKKFFYISLFISVFTLSYAQEKIPVKFSGLMYLDYYYNIDQFADSLKDLNGFQFRRIYFTSDFTLSEVFSSRFRLEADQSALTSNGRIAVFVKDAYLQWKNIFSGSDLVAGISPTPSFQISEEVWSYRSLEKTIMDLRNIVSARDFGIDLRGKLNSSGSVNYWLKIANNSGVTAETNKYKRFYALLHLKPFRNTDITITGDYDARPGILNKFTKKVQNNDRITAAFFAGLKEPGNFALGLETYFRNISNNYFKPGTTDLKSEKALGISAFGWFALSKAVNYVGRIDINDFNSQKDNDATLYIITGIDYHPHSTVNIIPNVIAQFYENANRRDVVGRITFNYSF